ncbi:Chromo domain-containing protein [Mycena kentingensis (nom. inval.)]|nr:Chromo domain-containing protein [Mycena kentingensis (nom. inval.)]
MASGATSGFAMTNNAGMAAHVASIVLESLQPFFISIDKRFDHLESLVQAELDRQNASNEQTMVAMTRTIERFAGFTSVVVGRKFKIDLEKPRHEDLPEVVPGPSSLSSAAGRRGTEDDLVEESDPTLVETTTSDCSAFATSLLPADWNGRDAPRTPPNNPRSPLFTPLTGSSSQYPVVSTPLRAHPITPSPSASPLFSPISTQGHTQSTPSNVVDQVDEEHVRRMVNATPSSSSPAAESRPAQDIFLSAPPGPPKPPPAPAVAPVAAGPTAEDLFEGQLSPLPPDYQPLDDDMPPIKQERTDGPSNRRGRKRKRLEADSNPPAVATTTKSKRNKSVVVKKEKAKWPKPTTEFEEHNGKFIQCDEETCKRWFHYCCVGIVPNDPRIRPSVGFTCPNCTVGATQTVFTHTSKDHEHCNRPDCPVVGDYYEPVGIYGRHYKNGRYLYLVFWKDYGWDEASWEPEYPSDELYSEFLHRARRQGFEMSATVILLKDAVEAGMKVRE